MADIPLITPDAAGIVDSTKRAAAASDTLPNDGKTMLMVENGATACVVTIASTASVRDGIQIKNGGATVPANETWFFGPFSKSDFDDSNGKVAISYDDVSNVSVLGIKLS